MSSSTALRWLTAGRLPAHTPAWCSDMPADSTSSTRWGPPPEMGTPREALASSTAAAKEERSKLQKHFGRLDIFFFLICTLVGVDTIGSVPKSGAQGFTWLAFLAVTFFVPYALLTA